ncbi:hypothetical protein [Methanocorpusculum bavaricum]|uniref:hypothetical protein n=1 Tax=Methanocorpusculum bavaricum TaxID=71518 RepID=UPI0005B28575|nr:hypothetical protein [Methanocorpusculum bavaricum]
MNVITAASRSGTGTIRTLLSSGSGTSSGVFPAGITNDIVDASETTGAVIGIFAAVSVPAGSGYLVIPGTKPDHPEYEPFTPAANYQWLKAEYIAEVPGTYYIAMVNKGTNAGNYGLALGFREEFTLAEWIMIPLSIGNVRVWEGSSQAFVVGFPVFIVLIGMVYLFRFKKEPLPLHPETLAGSAGGLLYLAGSGFMLVQALMALMKTGFAGSFLVTAIFILIPLVMGVLILRYMMRPVKYRGAKLILLGVLGVVVWGGYVVGPVLVICAGLKLLVDGIKQKEG